MSRRVIASDEINQMIRAELRKHEASDKVSLKSVYWQEPDITGCNWGVNMWDEDIIEEPASKEHIVAAIKDLRSRFNIPEPG